MFSDDTVPLNGLLSSQLSPDSPETILSENDPRFITMSEQIESNTNDLFKFNPNIPRAEVRASYIALLLAFSRFPRGRINVSIIAQTALLSHPFRGSRADVLARLGEIQKELIFGQERAVEGLQASAPVATLTVPNISLRDKSGKVTKVTADSIIDTQRQNPSLTVKEILDNLKDPEFLKKHGLTVVR